MSPQVCVWNDDRMSIQTRKVYLRILWEQVLLDPCFARSYRLSDDLAIWINPLIIQLSLQARRSSELILIVVDLDELVKLHSILSTLLGEQDPESDRFLDEVWAQYEFAIFYLGDVLESEFDLFRAKNRVNLVFSLINFKQIVDSESAQNLAWRKLTTDDLKQDLLNALMQSELVKQIVGAIFQEDSRVIRYILLR